MAVPLSSGKARRLLHTNRVVELRSVATGWLEMLQLVGVCGSFQIGLGEAILLRLAGKIMPLPIQRTGNNGMAGIFGFFWKWFWNDVLDFSCQRDSGFLCRWQLGTGSQCASGTLRTPSFDDQCGQRCADCGGQCDWIGNTVLPVSS